LQREEVLFGEQPCEVENTRIWDNLASQAPLHALGPTQQTTKRHPATTAVVAVVDAAIRVDKLEVLPVALMGRGEHGVVSFGPVAHPLTRKGVVHDVAASREVKVCHCCYRQRLDMQELLQSKLKNKEEKQKHV
jgi:hypothetical protein